MTATAKQPKASPSLTAYGITFPDTPPNRGMLGVELLRELWFFRNAWSLKDYTGPGSYQHARNAAEILWRQPGRELFQWHPDLETALEAYCEVGAKGETLVTGPASGGKTYGAAIYALLFWMSDPLNTGVLVCSTTLPGLKRRLWGDIRKLYMAVQGAMAPSNLVDSKTSIESDKGNSKRGIFGIAVAEGNEAKAMGKIIGFHPPNILVIVDELTDVSDAIVEALTNLFTGKRKAHFIGIGNATSIFDSHGKMCEPKDGWSSITVASDRWDTKRGGTCIHFDGMNSPNIVAGRIIFPFLLTPDDIKATIRDYGENSPQMWRMRRGFWCPEGVMQTVFTEQLIQRFMAMSKDPWESTDTKLWAALDPAFGGGDKCILRFGTTGKNSSGVEVLELGESVTIKTDLSVKDDQGRPIPVHFQIAQQVKRECISRGVDARHFGMDSTGEGGGLASIIANEWDSGFHQCEFGGNASELPISDVNQKRCCDEYANRVTELWFAMRAVLMAGQLRGLDASTAVEFCARLFTDKSKIKLERKDEMKLRMNGKSPDNADAVVVLMDTIKNRGGLGAAVSRARKSIDKAWSNLVAEFALPSESDYAEDAMAALL